MEKVGQMTTFTSITGRHEDNYIIGLTVVLAHPRCVLGDLRCLNPIHSAAWVSLCLFVPYVNEDGHWDLEQNS